MKKTETWAIRYFLPYKHASNRRVHEINATTIDRVKGKTITLLSGGKTVERAAFKEETKMLIGVFGDHIVQEIDRHSKQRVTNRYPEQRFEVPKPGFTKADYGDQWDILEKNRIVVEFLQNHAEVSWKDSKGNQLNPNFPPSCEIYYNLINLDGIEAEKADAEIKEHRLTGILIEYKSNPEELRNLAYGLAINPVSLSDNDIFNVIRDIIRATPDKFEKFINDGDKWYTIVLQKALRTDFNGEKIINDDGNRNYRMAGQLIASGFDSLITYFKDNEKLFEGLMNKLGMNGQPERKLKLPYLPAIPEVIYAGTAAPSTSYTVDSPVPPKAPKKQLSPAAMANAPVIEARKVKHREAKMGQDITMQYLNRLALFRKNKNPKLEEAANEAMAGMREKYKERLPEFDRKLHELATKRGIAL